MKGLLVAFAVLAVALPVHAQQLTLQIQDGRVTLDANGVPARQILDEWAKVGGTKVVGADKMTGGPMTIKVVNMPERQALEIVLRNAAGFMAAERQPSAPPGASAYDRILILATTSAPTAAANAPRGSAPSTAPTVGNANMAGTQRRLPPRPPNLPPSPAENEAEDNGERAQDEQEQANANPPVFTFPAPPGANAPNPNTQIVVPMTGNSGVAGTAVPSGAAAPPMITIQPNQNGQPTIYNFVPNSDGSMPQPGGFTVIGAPRPGMIQQPPPVQPAPAQPAQKPPPTPRQ